ncbi:cytochrome c, class I [Deinococcus radiopugnans]|uniref:Cytochrome c, class I n=1 Tax=Deinococcus radiopugnans TaxID=57497 RepID=A0A0A7KE47_9DEIO|nr:c-type cytochrome [Deinococcus radiopugnans]AIZ44401.1 cytochrome c, class I [Deinococcus radiopugnans]QLG10001.1 c-type cytochrome [Deinococcus sp. D7000]
MSEISNSNERGFSGREIAAAVVFVVLAAVIAYTSYYTGIGMSGGAGAGDMTAAAAQAPVNGESLYASNCAGCHGAGAVGGIGPALLETAAWSPAEFGQAVLHGQAPGGRTLAPVMPRFAESGFGGETATDEQVEAIHAYVKSLQ